jgi:SAM-dependent methyltransferase
MPHPSLDHLRAHHGDFAEFRDAMVNSSAGRFGPIWWGVWKQLVVPPKGATILDLGSGPGGLIPGLRSADPDARIIAVEVQPVMLETLRQTAEHHGAEMVVADLHEPLPLADEVADVVVSVMVLHEMMHPPALIDEMWRLTKPGGTLVLYDWVRWSLEDYLEGKEITPGVLEHFREHCLFTPDDLAYLCTRRGFEIVEVVGRRGNHYAIVVATKPLA